MDKIDSICVLVDNESWILPFARELIDWCHKHGYDAKLISEQSELAQSDITFLLGCVHMVTPENLAKARLNLVAHESDLPHGKGFAPIAWQILEGKNEIPVCLIEATQQADSGRIWLKDKIELRGTELCDEWRQLQGEATIRICQRFLLEYPTLIPKEQSGASHSYPRRNPGDSELNPDKSLSEQFELLRIVDNQRYPAFFKLRGKQYKIEITEYDPD
ncbi:formyltransferase family protein [Dongshaea marina]|uniref:formyltransferase family protein n=1 Tax=Dongshaea marina TaxID=2047966 RepID=UPI000D3E88DE|nr:formyltransferase family protein [Dongshaea marina]